MLCYALSFVVHASVVICLANTPVRASSASPHRAGSITGGPHREVTVTLTLRMTNLAQPGRATPPERLSKTGDIAPADQAADPSADQSAEPPADDASPQPPGPADNLPDKVAQRETTTHEQASEELSVALAADSSQSQTPPAASPTPQATTPDAVQPESSTQAIAQQVRELMDVVLPALAEWVQKTPDEEATAPQPAEATEPSDPVATLAEVELSETRAPAEQAEPAEPIEPIEAATPVEITPTARTAEKDVAEPAQPPATTTASTATVEPAEQNTPTPSTTARVYDEQSVDRRIEFKSKALPVLSHKSKQFGDKGTIQILVTVDADGTLLSHEIIDDAGQPRLLACALAALKDSTFHPAQFEGKPVRSKRLIQYAF